METKRSLYVHFDGMDLAGKTTACTNFIAESSRSWDIRRNRIMPENLIHVLADALRKDEVYDAEVLGNLYYVALMADLRSFTWPAVDTIQDSTIILRSIAYHTVRGTPRLPELFYDLLKEHPRFDASLVFTANLEARQKRLKMRMAQAPSEISEEDLMVLKKPERFMAMDACLIDMAKKGFRSTVIDTSRLTPIEVVVKIMENMPSRIRTVH